MKKVIQIIILFICANSFGQVKNSNFKFISVVSFKPTSLHLNWNSKNYWNANNLSIYNSITNTNDNYYVLGQKYQLSTTKSFSNLGWEGQRIDSFNPYGTADIKTALASGALNLFLSKF
jgi:hypothetical protein